MKLRTEIRIYAGGEHYAGVKRGDNSNAINHDALAAHALLHAMEENDMDGWDYNANVVAIVRERADELMREWTISEPSSNPR